MADDRVRTGINNLHLPCYATSARQKADNDLSIGRLCPNHYHSPYLGRTGHSLAFCFPNSSKPAEVGVGHNTLRPMCPLMG